MTSPYNDHGEFEDDVISRLEAQYLGVMRFNNTAALLAVPATTPWVVTSADILTIVLARQTKLLLDGNIYATVSGTVDFSYDFSPDDWTTVYNTDAYQNLGRAAPGARLVAGAKTRATYVASQYTVSPAPYAVLDLEPATWKFRLVKHSTGTGTLAENAGFALAQGLS